jgi:hypothetical protein
MRCYALLQEKFNCHMSCIVELSTSCSTESGKRANYIGAKSNVQPQLSQQFVFTTHLSRASGLGVAKCAFHETGLRVKPLLLQVGATFVIRCDDLTVSTLDWPDFDCGLQGHDWPVKR